MFHCEGQESALIDCPQNLTDFHREKCSTLQLSCAEPVKLVGGSSRCEGVVEMKHRGEWRPVEAFEPWTPAAAAAVCRDLDCGSAVSTEQKGHFNRRPVWSVGAECVKAATVRSCVYDQGYATSSWGLKVVCSESVRLDTGLCSGSLQIRNQSSDQSWTGVCEGALDHRGAEVLCRELRCGPPVLQGALSPLGQTFHCDGNESTLIHCPRTTAHPETNPETHPETCPAQTVTCSELRLVEGSSRCEGSVEVNYGGEWRPMSVYKDWTLEAAAAVCRDLDCGSAVFTEERRGLKSRAVWDVKANCVKDTAVRDCLTVYEYGNSDYDLVVLCSELLHVPEVSVSEGVWAPRAEGGVWAPRADDGDWTPLTEGGVWVQMDADFQITCSVKPQYPNGSFLLISPTANLTAPADNHSAHFLFTDAGPAHRGNYTCVYLLELFNHNLSSNATLHVYPGESDFQFLVRALILLLLLLLYFIPYFYYRQASRGQQRAGRAGRRRGREEERTDVVFEVVVPPAEDEI